ncbi:MAG TPA: hydroxysqualene dehydroxylase HpnE [Vicinamibacterales bacterium]|nr:hydroxysqualene dehydroxylase HpnE [Vicinamibacterales bacterium]
MIRPDVIVVGAGFAGLSAAAALAESGARVLVLDARSQLGGRATAFADRVTGELVDNGQHVLFGCYRDTLAFLARIGAMGNVQRQAVLRVPYLDRDGRRSVLTCPRLPPPLHLLGGVLKWNAIPLADRLAALRIGPPLQAARRELARTGRIVVKGGITVSSWLQAHGQRERLTEWLWAPLAVAALNQSPDEALAEPFVRVLAEMFGPDVNASAMVLPSRPLNQMYAEPARTFIEQRGGEVRTGALARIVADDARVAGVDVRGERIAAPVVVSTVPWHSMRTVFGDAPPRALAPLLAGAAAMTSKAIVTVNLWYDRRVMDDAFVGLPGREMQWVFDKRTAFGSEASHLSLVASGADALAAECAEAVVARAAAEVREALAGARNATLLRGTVVREKHATFSLAQGQPPRPGTLTAVKGLLLAGDWIDTGLPGTIESAVVAGHRAARTIAHGTH